MKYSKYSTIIVGSGIAGLYAALKIEQQAKLPDGIMLITADHGNCDIMWDENKVPITSHTTSPVPFIITKKDVELNNGILADVAPTIISLLNLEIPTEMDGKVLIK